MARAKIVTDGQGRFYGIRIDCPGCTWPDGHPGAHVLQTDWMPEGYERTDQPRPDLWGFNGDLERPTFTPSLKAWYGNPGEARYHCCHSFIRDGRIEYLSDCTHALAGQTVDLPDIGTDPI